MKRFISLLLLASSSMWAFADSASDYALQLGIIAPANAPLLRLPLNADVYRALRRQDLGDLRVFNAAGEALPAARLSADQRPHTLTVRSALTPLPAIAATKTGNGSTRISLDQGHGDMQVRIDVGGTARPAAAPTTSRFLVDTRAFGRRPVHAIELPLATATLFEGRLLIETSADLADWRILAASETILAVGNGDGRLARTRIAIKGHNARYLRLTWLSQPPAAMPTEVDLIHRQQPNAPDRQWLKLNGTVSGKHVDYLAPGLFPVDRLRLLPAQGGNDVVAAQVASRPGVSARWQHRIRTVGFRLQEGHSVRESAAATFPLTRDPLWRVSPDRPETVGAASTLLLGWLPDEIVFVARGPGPYVLAVGHPDRAPAWLAPHTIVPGYRSTAEAAMAVASLAPSGRIVEAIERPINVWQPGEHWWLWAALGLGVAVLGWMARSVWRDVN